MKLTGFFGIITALSFSITAAQAASNAATAASIENGKKLYAEHCTTCHDTKIHTRPNRIIHTYGDLVNRVKFCDAQSKAGFTDVQIHDVAEYLNTNFYKFVKD
jgi:cytochrome c2